MTALASESVNWMHISLTACRQILLKGCIMSKCIIHKPLFYAYC
jgi:hypothetical protein